MCTLHFYTNERATSVHIGDIAAQAPGRASEFSWFSGDAHQQVPDSPHHSKLCCAAASLKQPWTQTGPKLLLRCARVLSVSYHSRHEATNKQSRFAQVKK
jgi:hypothetical protein